MERCKEFHPNSDRQEPKFFLDIMFDDKLCIIFVFSAWPNLHQLQDNWHTSCVSILFTIKG